MTTSAKVILDSIAPNGARLTTFELTYPRMIHAELMTHRVFSRNAASSRAIPTPAKIKRIREDMAMPSEWGVNQKGMQSGGALDAELAKWAEQTWRAAGNNALRSAEVLCGQLCARCFNDPKNNLCRVQGFDACIVLDLHKQVANRVPEPFDHITVVLSATRYNNHWKLRLEVDPATGRPYADPTYFELASKWRAAFDTSTPTELDVGQWHLPYITLEDYEPVLVHLAKLVEKGQLDQGLVHFEREKLLRKMSVGRCARVSYMRQGQGDIEDNVVLHDRLAASGHWSPFEHVARPIAGIEFKRFMENEPRTLCPGCHNELRGKVLFVPHPSTPGAKRVLCFKCGHGHATSGNFLGFHQYRKDFPGEAGGDD